MPRVVNVGVAQVSQGEAGDGLMYPLRQVSTMGAALLAGQLGSSLILVRHSLVAAVPGVSANGWRLSIHGRARCRLLATHLAAYSPQRIITSYEPKAIETGEIVAAALGLPLESAPGLHEHERSTVPLLERPLFEAQVAAFFARPTQLVFGEESANHAANRFSKALAAVVAAHPDETLAVVTHGTVLTLFVTRLLGGDAFRFWQQLGLPAYVVLSLPDYTRVQCTPTLGDIV